MDSFECYRTFISLKLHFNDWEYDYFNFQGKARLTRGSLARRKDRFWFDKLEYMPDQLNRMLAQYCEKNNPYIRDVCTDTDTYLARQKRIESLPYFFKDELKVLKPDFDANFKVTKGHPYLLKEYMGKRLSLEALTIIAHLTECIPYWKKHLTGDMVCDSIIMRIVKYHSFLNYDREQFQKIMIDFCREGFD